MTSNSDRGQIVLKLCKNDPRDVIKMREMREEVEKKTLKKEIDNPSFLWRQKAEFCPATWKTNVPINNITDSYWHGEFSQI